MKDFNRTYADGLACRWAAKHVGVDEVDELVVLYGGQTAPYSTWTGGNESYLTIYAMVGEERHNIYVTFPEIIDGMVTLAAEEGLTSGRGSPPN